MITYEQLYNVNVDSLAWAVDQWDTLISRLKAMDEACADEVVKPFEKAGWTSSDMTSVVAQARVAAVNQEFGDALQEAKGIRGVLSNAHDTLKKHKDDLHQLADEDAKKAGLVVSPKGEITPREDCSQNEGLRHDPDGQQAIAQQQRNIEALQARIEKVLNDAAETDREAATALRHDIGTGDNDFNGKAVTSIAADESLRATSLLNKLDTDGELSQHDLNELERVMDHNQHDPEFNRMMLNRLGPKKTLELADKLDQIHSDQEMYEGHRKQYATIQRSLANGIGAANQDKEFSDKWRADMRALGTAPVDNDGDTVHALGYQALAGLLKHGDGSGYPPHMTTGLTDDIIAAEREHPGIWDEHDQVTKGTGVDPVAVKDPVDDMLGVMSKDPDTATRYLDPAHDGGKDRLDYLLKKRDWPDLEVAETTGRGDQLDTEHIDATNSCAGLGNVLEAATTGAQPGREHITYDGHTEGQARIMQETIKRLDSDNHGDEIPKNMQQPLARALSDYTEDTHNIIAGGYKKYGNTETGTADAWHKDGEDKYHIGAREESVLRVLRGVSSDPKAYAQIYEAERIYSADQMSRAGTDPGTAGANWQTPARDAGNVLGAYNAIGADVILDERDNKKQWADDTAKYVYHGAGIPLTAIPVIGDTTQRLVDQSTYDWSKDVKATADSQARGDTSRLDAHGIDGTYDLIDRWAVERRQDPDGNVMRQLKQEAEQSYGISRARAARVLRGEY
ncbi:hypothetical protein [Streptomyces sp. cg2]|uniref:hypothetical protein n=1 Tax=Streptomyces sp. cg2 TaxID=3238799 RepID=UPI0034E30083